MENKKCCHIDPDTSNSCASEADVEIYHQGVSGSKLSCRKHAGGLLGTDETGRGWVLFSVEKFQ